MSADVSQGPFVLGLTGSIGMGKSTTAKMFSDLGVPVYDADAMVHRLYEGEAAPALEAAFPGVTQNGKVDRARLAAQVVGKPDELKRLESIVHPMLRAHETAFLAAVAKAGAPVCVFDIPLLFETGAQTRVDAVLVVSAPEEVQRARLMQRPGMDREKLNALLARQMPDAQKREWADFVVDTSQGLEPVRARIGDILARIATMERRRKI